jgi:hypothetical protein
MEDSVFQSDVDVPLILTDGNQGVSLNGMEIYDQRYQ